MSLIVFISLALIPLVFDMYLHRRQSNVGLREASVWSAIYVACALLFAGYLATESLERASLFLSGYAIEKALSVDNLMIFAAIFSYFGIRPEHQHRVLHWGIVGSVVLRLLFVATGVTMMVFLGRPLEFVFGVFVLWTSWKLWNDAGDGVDAIDHEARWYIRLTRRFIPIAADVTDKFFIFHKITTMFLCLIAIEFTDIAFAFDSVPAVIAVTREPLLVYASIMFAILGLRSLYFVMEALKKYLINLQNSVTAVLGFIGFKLLAHGLVGFEIGPVVSPCVVLGLLAYGVVSSLWQREQASTA